MQWSAGSTPGALEASEPGAPRAGAVGVPPSPHPVTIAVAESSAPSDTVPYAFAARAAVRPQTGDPEGAARDAGTALRIGPDYPLPALAMLAAARAGLGDTETARTVLARYVRLMREVHPE